MNKRLTAILIALLMLVPQIKAQNDSINAYLITCQPGKAIYELYGHSAIWIEDTAQGTDVVFNYGLFDFNTPHFVWRFTMGETDYILGATRMRSFLREYRERGSEVYAQKLNLMPDEAKDLYDKLVENCHPDKMVYRYNFLYNNCATMAIDKIEKSILGTVSYQSPDTTKTFRSILTEFTSVRPWSRFAVNIVIGAEADRLVGYRQESFAPLYLKKLASSAVITDTAGTVRPFILDTTCLVEPEKGVDFGNPLFTPLQTMWMAFMLVLLISLLGWHMNRSFLLLDFILLTVQGLAGIIIFTLFFFSEHPTVDSNWLIICLNPLPLVFAAFVVHKIRKNRISIFLVADFVVCTAFLLLLPIIPQQIDTAVAILIATFALRAFSSTVFMFVHRRSESSRTRPVVRHSVIVLAALLLLPASLHAAGEKRPKLVVGITVDQLDRQNIEMMLPLLGDEGIKMLWYNGYNRDYATFDYDNPDRASAVASIHTGASPFQHGIVAGRWMNRKTLLASSLLDDGNRNGINTIEHTSPQKLLASNLADEMKLASSGRSRICSIAFERDASVLAAGHEADVAIWINHENGMWCSSDYYGSLPAWVERMNDTISRRYYEWHPALSADEYLHLSESDNGQSFSHIIRLANAIELSTSPMANDRVNAAAIAAIDAMKLGGDDTPDLLALTYYAGNYFNEPNSIYSVEQQDICVRLDRNIAELIQAVNEKVGAGNVLFFLTSTGYTDYQAPDLSNTRIPTGTMSMERATALLNLYLSAKYGSDKYVDTYYCNQIYLNHTLLENKDLAMHEVLDNCTDLLVQVSGIKSVMMLRDLMTSVPDIETTRRRNSYHKDISGDIIIESLPGWVISDENEGTVFYQRPVQSSFPMIIYGNGIRPEINHEPVSVSVLIPTICNILHCDVPNACYSKPLNGLK